MATTDPMQNTVQDLSHLAAHALNASSQAATNTVSDNSAAMTAPGSASESTAAETPGDPALHPQAVNADITHVHGDGPSHLGEGGRATWQAIARAEPHRGQRT